MTQKYMGIKQFSEYTGIPVGTIRNKLIYHPEQLPPFSQISIGITKKKTFFCIEEVDEWMKSNLAR